MRALRMRPWICRQFAMAGDCINAHAALPAQASNCALSPPCRDTNAGRRKLVHHSAMPDSSFIARLKEKARAIGFALCGVTRANHPGVAERLPEWLAHGYAGEMQYMHDSRRRSVPDAMPEARSVIVCAMNYNAPLPYSTAVFADHESNAAAEGADGVPRAWISRYAWGDDYHDVVGPKLDELVAWLRSELGENFQARAYVDTGPVLERVAAHHAGLGWLAKNTCLINQQIGSWLFLGVILTDLDLAPELAGGRPPRDLCGSCTRCIDACPTDALVAPYVLDARRCISYLTIELRGAIPDEFRAAMGSMVFGCDICQDVCPWNRKSPQTSVAEFLPRRIAKSDSDRAADDRACRSQDASLFLPSLEWLVSLTEEEFRLAFRGSPVKRTKYRGLLRNACIALGNSSIGPENPAYGRISHRLEALAHGADPILAEHARWALTRLHVRNEEQAHGDTPHNLVQSKTPIPVAQRRKFMNHAEEE